MPLHSELLAEERNIYPTRFMHSDSAFDLHKASEKSESTSHRREFGNRRGMDETERVAKAIGDNGSEAITNPGGR
jgi:hypothetical protein